MIGILAFGMKSWLTIACFAGSNHYWHTENPGKSLILADYRPITPRLPPISSRTNPKRDRMAGHSQFKNIMHRKGRQDAQKSKLFSKLAREITVAAKMGAPDPGMNARLRAAIISARQENMSKDNRSSARSRRRPAATARITTRSATRATVPAASP